MHLRKVLVIFQKDLLDAIRDARVLMAILAPLGIGILYNFMFNDQPVRPEATVAYTAVQTALPEQLQATIGQTLRLTFITADNQDALRTLLEEKKADVGLVIPEGFDAAVASGQAPPLGIILPPSSTFGGDYVAAALEPALRQIAGQGPIATIQTERLTATSLTSASMLDRIGLRRYFVMVALVMLVVMIAMLALPVILVEETEKKTLDALALITSYADVVAGKTLVGAAYIAVSTVLLLSVTRLNPADPLLFIGALLVFSVTLVGFGLLLASLFHNANQLNTWGGLILVPVIAPAFIVGLDAPRVVNLILWLIPSSQATRLIINAVSGQAIFPHAWLSLLVVLAWGAVAYSLLLWRLSHRAE